MGTVARIRGGATNPPVITLAMLAHDAKKEDLRSFTHAHREIMGSFRILAPEDTARVIADQSLDVDALAPDMLGGDMQIGAAVVEGRVDAVIFLHDPLAALPAEPDVKMFLKVCDLERVPIATNLATAEILIRHLGRISRSGARADRHPSGRAQGLERVLWLAAAQPQPTPEGESHG